MKEKKQLGKVTVTKTEKVFYYTTLFTFLISIVYVVYRIIYTAKYGGDEVTDKVMADYLLMLLQLVAGAIIIHIPSFVERRIRIEVPSFMNILFIIFLFCAIYLGEVQFFYYKIAFWDTILHFFSAVMLGCLSFSVINALSANKIEGIHPLFVMIFAFCFAITIEVIWEFYEFCWDFFAGFNMQKYQTEEGINLIGQAALIDTMEDLFVGAVGAFLASLAGFFSIKKNTGFVRKMILTKQKTENTENTDENIDAKN
ncbi:MAG: hypothetical protein RR327_04650 [Clostridia bacterium]